MADKFDVTAEATKTWSVRGEPARVAEAAPDLQAKVSDGLRSALQSQLAAEVSSLGNIGDRLTIHGRTGVSNIQLATERVR